MAVDLLRQAREAGLKARIDADGRLVLSGPKRLGDMARELLAHREDVLEALRAEAGDGLSPVAAPHRADPPPGDRIVGWPLEPEPPLDELCLSPDEFLDTITAQHCHPRVLAERIGIPLDEVLRRLESSPWSGHGARARARLGLCTSPPPHQPVSPNRQAPPEPPLHFMAR